MTDLEPSQGSVPLLTETRPSETEGNDANNTTVPFPRKNTGDNSVSEPTSSTAAPVENASEASSRRPVTRSLSGRPGPTKRSAMNSVDYSADENEEQEVPPTKKQKTARRSTRKSNSAAAASAANTGTASTDVPMDDSTSQSLPVPAPEQSTSTVSELTDVDPDTSVSTNAPATPLIATRIGTKRAMRATLPTPVPNLTKKSRGRRVPVRVVTTTGAEIITQPVPGPAGTFAAETGSGPSGNTKDKRSYVCSVEGCGKCFFRGEHLKRHIRSIHTHEKPFKCTYPECDKNFNRHDNLLQHLKVHKQAQATAAMTANGGPVVLLPNGSGIGGELPKSTKKSSSSSKGKSKSDSGSKSTSAKSKDKGKRSSGSGRGRGKRKRRAASSDDDDEDDDDEIQDEGQDSDQVGSEDASGSDSGSDNDNDEEEDAVATAEAEASAVNNLLSLRSRSRSSAALKSAPTLITPLHHTLTSSYAPTFSTLSSATLGTLGGTLGSLGGSGSVSSPSSSSSTSTLVAVGSASGWGYPTGSSASSFLGSKPSFISAFAPAFSFTTTTGIGTFHPDQHYHAHSFIQSQGPGGGAGGPFSLSKAAYPTSTSSTSSPGPGPGPGQSSLPTGQMSYQPHQQHHHQMHGGPNGLGYHMMNMNQSGAGAGAENGVGGETSFQSQLHALNGMNMNGSGETSFQSNMALSSLRSTSTGTTMRSAGAGAGAGTGVSMNVEDANGNGSMNGNTMVYGNVNGTGKQVVNVGGDVRDVHGGVPVSVSVAVPSFRGGPGARAGMDMEGMTTNAAQLQSQTQADVANASIDTNQNANGIDINTMSSTLSALSQPQPDGAKTAESVNVDVAGGEGNAQSGHQSQFLAPSTSTPVSISTAVDHVGADENGNVNVHGKEIQVSVLSSGEGNPSSGPEPGLSSAGMFPILQNGNGNKTGNGNVDSVILEMENNASGNGDGKANGSVVNNGIDVTSGSVSSSF